MPTYQNDSTTTIHLIKDIYDEMQPVAKDGGQIETYEDLSGNADFSLVSADPANEVSITAQNTWTAGVRVRRGTRQLNLSVSGISGSTVTLQRSEDDGTTWTDVQTWTADVESYINDAADETQYRVGIKTGEYGSGTTVVRLSK